MNSQDQQNIAPQAASNSGETKSDKAKVRQQRLAAELRKNLRNRKNQARQRRNSDKPDVDRSKSQDS